MDDIPIPARDEEQKLFSLVAPRFGEPAFARRARRVQEALEQLLARCRHERELLLQMVRLRLGTLYALAGEWEALQPLLADEHIELLRQLHAELKPQLRVPVEPTDSLRQLRRALEELTESVQRFNRRWQAFLRTVDVAPVNEQREGYNRYYVLEKECALRSPKLARQGFRRLEPLTVEQLAELLPLLPQVKVLGG